jgi:CMP-N,N'-diacetyllegionaminic acid synthase
LKNSKNNIALIQARGGSKGVPGKNIRIFHGYPILAWSIAACKLAQKVSRVMLSTDDDEIAEVGRRYGAEVPFIRPSELATDSATDYGVIKHAVDWVESNSEIPIDLVIQIRPTTPLRSPHYIDEAIGIMEENLNVTGLRSVYQMPETAWKTFELDEKGMLQSVLTKLPGANSEVANQPRQALPNTYFGQGFVDIVRPEVIKNTTMTYGERVYGFITPDVGEIDVESDFDLLTYKLIHLGYGREVLVYLEENFKAY